MAHVSALLSTLLGLALWYWAVPARAFHPTLARVAARYAMTSRVLGVALAGVGLERFCAVYGTREGVLLWIAALMTLASLLALTAPLLLPSKAQRRT